MTPWAVAVAGLILCLAPRPAPAQGERAGDASYVVGAGGWSSERFGAHVAILRAGVAGSGAGAGFLLLSCEAGERRFRLSLPAPIAPPSLGPGAGGTILLRAAGGPSPGRGHVVAAVALTEGRVLSRAESGRADGLVPALGALLRTRPARLDLLFRPDGAPRLPARAVPTVLAIVWRDGDGPAIDDFLAACAR